MLSNLQKRLILTNSAFRFSTATATPRKYEHILVEKKDGNVA